MHFDVAPSFSTVCPKCLTYENVVMALTFTEEERQDNGNIGRSKIRLYFDVNVSVGRVDIKLNVTVLTFVFTSEYCPVEMLR